MAAAGDFNGEDFFEAERDWQGPHDFAASGPTSGELIDVSQMTTGILARTEQMRAVRNSRNLLEQNHAARLAACREDLAAVQRVLYETAEQCTALYGRWIVLDVTMSPDLAQIARKRTLEREMAEKGRYATNLRHRYEEIDREAGQHEIALRAFDRWRKTGQPGGKQ